MSHISDKAKTLAQATAAELKYTEAEIDEGLQTLSDVKARKDTAMSKIKAAHSDMLTGTQSLEEVAKNLTNE